LKDAARAGEGLHARQQQALELDKRLLEEDDVVQSDARDAPDSEAEVNRVLRELVVVFLAREPLLLGCRNQLTVAQ